MKNRYRLDTSKVLGIICAGGDGTRIQPLSRYRAKPAVPIGANYRLVDISLSNNLNSTITHNYVVVQKHPRSLVDHLESYLGAVARMRGQFIRSLSPPKEEERFFMSDADSLIQLRTKLTSDDFDIVLVTMADQVVKIDYRKMIEFLFDQNTDAVMVYNPVAVEIAKEKLGVIEIDSDKTVFSIEEKPQEPKEIPGKPGTCYSNLAMYAIRMETFKDMLNFIQAHHKPESTLSYSGIPWLIKNRKVVAFSLEEGAAAGSSEREKTYFADTANIDAWFDVQMRICGKDPVFNFYSREWPIYTALPWSVMAPAKIDNAKHISEALFGLGVSCEDGVSVEKSIVGTATVIEHNSSVKNSVILSFTEIGSNCSLDRVVIDKGIKVPDGTEISPLNPPDSTIHFDDLFKKIKTGKPVRENAPILTEGGILVFPKYYKF